MSDKQELQVLDAELVRSQTGAVMARPPDQVLAEAKKAADALQTVIKGKAKPVMMNGEQYLEFEDWQTLGRFYGISARVEKTSFVEYGSIKGFTAHAVAVRSDGQIISAAEADCLTDEEKWSSRSRYEWVDGAHGREKRKVSDEPVPLFQLKSMAQTRACAKCLRNVLAWVVVLAGYRPTPAEEIDRDDAAPLQPAVTKASTPAAAASGATHVKSIEKKSGKSAKGEWTRYTVRFDDGRQATTFRESEAQHAERAKAAGAQVIPIIEKNDKGYFNLKGFEAWPKAAEHAHVDEAPHVEEPVKGPEKVLTVRKIKTDKGDRFIIQTDKRQLATDQAHFADVAIEARNSGAGILPSFSVVLREDGVKFNKLTNLLVISVPEAAAPKKDKAKPAKGQKKRDREPGEEG